MSKFNKRLKELKQDPLYNKDLNDYVQVYVDFAIEKINQVRARTPDALVLLETKLDYSPWVPGGFGTGDLVLVGDGVLEVVDFKFGQGVAVSAVDNPQMRLYALGAVNEFGCLYDINTVRMTICQPRLDSISTDQMTLDDLLYWANNTVMGAAEKAWKGEGDFVAGEHCRFCRIRYTCRARADENMKLACYDFKAPLLLTDEEITEILSSIDELQKWAKDIQAYAQDQALNQGKEWPGFKLVEGKSSRKYADEGKVVEALTTAGFEEEKIYSKSLLTITAMEKAIGKKKFKEILGGLITKPPGKPKLVPVSDKRPEINSTAEIDFKN